MNRRRPHTLVARLDNAGDVLLAGPAVRAVAASGHEVVFLAGPAGAAAADLLPGVDRVVVWNAPWLPGEDAVDPAEVLDLVDELRRAQVDEALVLTSFHQSPLPLALVLRLAGVAQIAATSVDFAGALLDHRLPYEPALHEVEQQLLVAGSLGHLLAPGDSNRLAVRPGPHPPIERPERYVVVHPSASVPSRSISPALAAGIARRLGERHQVVLTGTTADERITAAIAAAAPGAVDLAGRTCFAGLADVLRGADVLVTGNTGPAHLAAAVGTPVVSVFAPTVDPDRWRPWRVPHVLLGDLEVGCAGCRARSCPLPGQPCTSAIDAEDVAEAVETLLPVAVAVADRSVRR